MTPFEDTSCSVSVERNVAQFGKTITYKFYRQNKYAGRFITENVCAQPGVTLFFCNCNIM